MLVHQFNARVSLFFEEQIKREMRLSEKTQYRMTRPPTIRGETVHSISTRHWPSGGSMLGQQ